MRKAREIGVDTHHQILNSLFYASVLFLIAAGLSLIFGVMRIVNMAHGSFYALGAFVTAWRWRATVAPASRRSGTFLLLPTRAPSRSR